MRPEVGPLSGQSADARDGGARPSGSPAGSRTEEGQEDQETQGQCTGIGSAGRTQTNLWGGSDLDRWHPCDDGADHPLGDRHGHECLPNREPLASWLGLTPSKDISGGKVIGPGRRKVQNRVAMALRMAATTLLRSASYLGGRYRHLRKQLPSKAAAVKAMARHLAVLVYRMLTKGEAWVDRGATKIEQKRTELELAYLKSKALAKGFQLTPITAVS